MGMLSRRKGQAFERRVARLARDFFKDFEIRRSIQSRGAEESDLVGVPFCWSELQHADARHHDPLGKLEQAERDRTSTDLMPVAITCVSGSGRITATFRVAHLEVLTGIRFDHFPPHTPFTLELEDFFMLLGYALSRHADPPLSFPATLRASRV